MRDGGEKNLSRPVAGKTKGEIMKRMLHIDAEILEDERAYGLQAEMGPGGLGYLVSLWLWACRQFNENKMDALSCFVLETAAQYRGIGGKPKDGNTPGKLCEVLLAEGYLEESGNDGEPLYRLVDLGKQISVVEKKR